MIVIHRTTILLLCTLLPRAAKSFYAQPEAVQFTQSPGHVTWYEGSGPVVLRCSITLQPTVAQLPRPLIEWMVNGRAVTELSDISMQLYNDSTVITSQLTLLTPHISHSGWYQCEARDGNNTSHCTTLPCVPAITRSNSAAVQVLSDTVTTSIETCEVAVVLWCGGEGESPPTVWLRDGSQLSPDNQTEWFLPNGDLLVHRHGNSSHTYTCITNSANITLSQHKLHIFTQPTALINHTNIQLHNPKQVLFTGQSSALTCTYNRKSCDQPAEVRWYHNGVVVDSTRPLYHGSVLPLEKVGVAQTGMYCCSVDEVETCTTLVVVEQADESSTRFLDPTLNNSTLHLPTPFPAHPQLQWFHNGRQLESYDGLESLNRTSEPTFDLYGIYQLFVNESDGTLRELFLTRVMPYGWSNPPGPPTLTKVPRSGTGLFEEAVRVNWIVPLYMGGVDNPWFNVQFGPTSTSHTRGNYLVSVLDTYSDYSISVGVASENRVELSEWGDAIEQLATYDSLCGSRGLPPPNIHLSCDQGSVSFSFSHTTTRSHVIYAQGGCMEGNISHPYHASFVLESVAVGTTCGFDAAAAERGFPDGCQQGERCQCYNPYNLEYSPPAFCNVTGAVQFDQSEYRVDEGDSVLQVCATAQSYGFSVAIEMTAYTARASEDYISKRSEFTFTADTLTHCLNVSVLEDTEVEGNETFNVTMTTDHPLVSIPTPAVSVTIVDNDNGTVQFDQSEYRVDEGDLVLQVCATAQGYGFSVVMETVNDTAVASEDYVSKRSEFTFTADTLTHCLNVNVLEDTEMERNKMFFVTMITDHPLVSILTPAVSVTIVDNDHGTVQFDQSEYRVDEGDSVLQVCATAQGYGFSVVMETVNNTAVASEDYVSKRSEFTFTADTLTHCLNVNVLEDTETERNKMFFVTMITDHPLVSILTPAVSVTIVDNDNGTVQFDQSEYRVDEGDSVLQVCATAQGYGFSVAIEMTAYTARASEDYISKRSEFTFTADTLTHCLNVSVLEDTEVEGNETFNVTMTTDHPLVGIPTPAVSVTIVDNDNGTVQFNQSEYRVDEGDSVLQICATAQGYGFSVVMETVNDTAVASEDYVSKRSEFTFTADTLTHCLNMSVLEDREVEGNETFNVAMTTDHPLVSIPTPAVSVTIVDNDNDATTDIAATTNTPGSNMTVTGDENIKLASILGVVLGVAFVLFLVVITLCVFLGWRRHQNRRYERQIRKFGYKKGDTFYSDFEDPVSIGPGTPVSTNYDDITLYEEYYPAAGSGHSLNLSINKASSREGIPLEAPKHVTSQELLEHLEKYTNYLGHYQQDSGIGEYPGRQMSYDFGSAFSGHSITSYVHCKQYSCMCRLCVAVREGKYPLNERGNEMLDADSSLPYISILSMSLPELRSCDHHVTPSISSAISSEII